MIHTISPSTIRVKCLNLDTHKFEVKEAKLLKTLKSGDILVLINGEEKWKAFENIVK